MQVHSWNQDSGLVYTSFVKFKKGTALRQRVFLVATCLLLILSDDTSAGDARDAAITAYHMMEESPLDSTAFNNSFELIQSAHEEDPDEPWVYIASSMATLQAGYKIGSWFSSKSFNSGIVDKAEKLAEKATRTGKSESQSYAHLARIKIIKGKYRMAWDLLNKAYKYDNNNFYAWFYKAIIHYYMKGYEDSWTNLDEAEQRITHRYQKKLVTRQRQRIARKRGDKTLEERLYKKNIEDFPDNAYMYGNYGGFLLQNNRPEEAVSYYEKAIFISPYPHAIKKLKEARRKAGMK